MKIISKSLSVLIVSLLNVNSVYGQIPANIPINNVSDLRDVTPNDWAYEALQNLSQRYQCLQGYSDNNFKGKQAVTRYEFAVMLNVCLQKIETLNSQGERGLSDNSNLDIITRLNQDFQPELTTLREKIDTLDTRLTSLEQNQFSTTTKLDGEVIFTGSAAFGSENKANSQEELDNEFTFSDRIRLNLYSSFTGKDRLKIRLESGNFYGLNNATGTDMTRLGHEVSNNNDVEITDVIYRFPIGKNVRTWIGANGFSTLDMADLHNPILGSSSSGALTRFNYRNPAVFRNGEQQGLGFNIKFNQMLGMDLAYFTGNAENPSSGNGLFNGDYTAFGQLNIKPNDNINLGVALAYSYYPSSEVNFSGSTGSKLARQPFGKVPTSGLRVGIQGDWKINEHLVLAGWGGYVNAKSEAGINENNKADIWNWSANISYLDLFKEGDFLALAGGMPPKATSIENGSNDPDTSHLIELLYSYPVNDNIAITPGFYVILNPEHNANNDSIWVGAVRTTFKF
jgi:Carbohydrate-selective porin, OprB family/S-layer homology domain